MSDYTLTQVEFKRLKTKLTRAVNSQDDARIIRTVDAAMAIFDEQGSPDDWNRWNRAKDDALVRQRYARMCSPLVAGETHGRAY